MFIGALIGLNVRLFRELVKKCLKNVLSIDILIKCVNISLNVLKETSNLYSFFIYYYCLFVITIYFNRCVNLHPNDGKYYRVALSKFRKK